MSPYEINEAIAEHCGISVYEENDGSRLWSASGPCWSSYKTGVGREHALRVSLPDYTSDLSARNVAWLTLTIDGRALMRQWIERLARENGVWEEEVYFKRWPEAFLRTVGKWKEAA